MIRQLAKGKWEVQVYVRRDPVTGRRIRISKTVHGTKKDAQNLEAKLRLQVHEHEPGAAAGEPMSAVFAAWLDHVKPNLSINTYVGYEQKVRLYLEPELGEVALGALTAHRIDTAYSKIRSITSRRGQPLSATTVHHCHTVLHAALAQAVRWDWIDRNPADRATPPAVEQRAETTPDVDQAVALLRAALARTDDPLLGPFVALGIATGARRGAICGVRWDDIDFQEATVILRRSIADAGGIITVKGPKTKKPPRPKKLGGETVEILRARHLQAKAAALELGQPLSPDAWIFSYDGMTLVAPGTLGRRFARLAEVHAPGVRFHDLRHFSVTHLLGQGVNPKDVADRHDHASLRMTLDVYSHALPAGDATAADAMDQVVGAARQAPA